MCNGVFQNVVAMQQTKSVLKKDTFGFRSHKARKFNSRFYAMCAKQPKGIMSLQIARYVI